MDRTELTERMNILIMDSKIPPFFSIRPSEERPSIVRAAYARRNLFAVVLDLTPKEIERAKIEKVLFAKVAETFLSVLNHVCGTDFTNITFTPLFIDGKRFPSCLVAFKGKNSKGPAPFGYKEIAGPVPIIENRVISNQQEKAAPPDETTAQRTYREIASMLATRDVSVRKVFAIGMKQWQSRLLFSRLVSLGLFEISKENQNEKTFFPENFSRFTIADVEEVLSMEKPPE